MAQRRDDLEPRLHTGAGLRPGRGAPGARRLTSVGYRGAVVAREIAHRAARDPEQEQVEDGQEAELQRDGERLVHRASVELVSQFR